MNESLTEFTAWMMTDIVCKVLSSKENKMMVFEQIAAYNMGASIRGYSRAASFLYSE